MAHITKILHLISKAFQEERFNTAVQIKQQIEQQFPDNEGLAIIEKYIQTLEDTNKNVAALKKKRSSSYTLFIKDRMKVFKTPELTNTKQLMKLAVEAWKAVPKDVKERMKVLYKENPTLSGGDLYAMATYTQSQVV